MESSALSLPGWVLLIGWITKAVLGVLVLLSVWSVKLMIERKRAFEKFAALDTEVFEKLKLQILTQGSGISTSSSDTKLPLVVLHRMKEVGPETPGIELTLRSLLVEKRMELSKDLSNLATLGSNAPFVGLFGTILGIIQAFGTLAYGQSAMSSVMSAIAEALVATAVGLFVAIPAVVAYNHFFQKLKTAIVQSESLRDLLLAKVRAPGGRI
jgi:biopolymer transport protein ExbB